MASTEPAKIELADSGWRREVAGLPNSGCVLGPAKQRGDQMKRYAIVAGVLGLSALVLAPSQSQAAVYSRSAGPALGWDTSTNLAGPAQYWQRGSRYGVRPYYAGRPYWYHRPWVRRPYYGRIVAGVALGTIITVAAVGLIPRRPAPDLCWYWVDPYRSRGYWDYCY